MAYPVTKIETQGAYWEIIRSQDVAELTMAESLFPPGFQQIWHSHDLARFSLFLEGSQTERLGAWQIEHKAMSLTFLPEGHEHDFYVHGLWHRVFTIEVACSLTERVQNNFGRLVHMPYYEDCLSPWIVARIYTEFRTMDDISPLVIEGLSLELMAATSRHSVKVNARRPPKWLREARDMVQEQFTQPLSLRDIAQRVGVHPVSLARAFREHYRGTIGDTIRQLRIQFACQKLCASNAPLSEIAYEAGFADQSHFTRTFKRIMGLSPSAFRANAGLR